VAREFNTRGDSKVFTCLTAPGIIRRFSITK